MAIPAAVQALIGKAGEPVVHEVERGAIRRFCDAVGDPNPLFRDPQYARTARYGAVIAPPGFFGWAVNGPLIFQTGLVNETLETITRAGFPRSVDGGIEYEFHGPVYEGDTLVAFPRIVGAVEREGKTGNMLFITIGVDYQNQHGKLVCRALSTFIRLRAIKEEPHDS